MLTKLVTTLIVSSILFSCKKQDNFHSDLTGSDTIVRFGNNSAFGYYYVFTPPSLMPTASCCNREFTRVLHNGFGNPFIFRPVQWLIPCNSWRGTWS